MNSEEYGEHFVNLLKNAEMGLADVDGHVQRAVTQGLKDFWGASNWPFKVAEKSLTLTNTAYQNLPANFESGRSLTSRDTSAGVKLIFKSKEVFDEMAPNPELWTNGVSYFFTVYRTSGQTWRISFLPRPEGGETVYLVYYMTTPSNTNSVPDMCQAVLELFIAKRAYPYGHPARIDAEVSADRELKLLETRVGMDQSNQHRMQDDTEMQMTTIRPWL